MSSRRSSLSVISIPRTDENAHVAVDPTRVDARASIRPGPRSLLRRPTPHQEVSKSRSLLLQNPPLRFLSVWSSLFGLFARFVSVCRKSDAGVEHVADLLQSGAFVGKDQI